MFVFSIKDPLLPSCGGSVACIKKILSTMARILEWIFILTAVFHLTPTYSLILVHLLACNVRFRRKPYHGANDTAFLPTTIKKNRKQCTESEARQPWTPQADWIIARRRLRELTFTHSLTTFTWCDFCSPYKQLAAPAETVFVECAAMQRSQKARGSVFWKARENREPKVGKRHQRESRRETRNWSGREWCQRFC